MNEIIPIEIIPIETTCIVLGPGPPIEHAPSSGEARGCAPETAGPPRHHPLRQPHVAAPHWPQPPPVHGEGLIFLV